MALRHSFKYQRFIHSIIELALFKQQNRYHSACLSKFRFSELLRDKLPI